MAAPAKQPSMLTCSPESLSLVPKGHPQGGQAVRLPLAMGRTVPTWRTRIEDELQNLEAFRRALPSTEKPLLDALCTGVRHRRTAGGMLPSHDVWKPMLLSMLVEIMVQNSKLEHRILELERAMVEQDDRHDS